MVVKISTINQYLGGRKDLGGVWPTLIVLMISNALNTLGVSSYWQRFFVRSICNWELSG
tara:strand:+ start:18 stop:194 length:177 start_codon:yes stop_codon:yes gene_type:complete